MAAKIHIQLEELEKEKEAGNAQSTGHSVYPSLSP